MNGFRSNPLAYIDSDNLRDTIDTINFPGKFMVRNVNDEEIQFLTSISRHYFGTRFLPTPHDCVLELTGNASYKNCHDIKNGFKKLLTLLRLNNPGRLGVLICWLKNHL